MIVGNFALWQEEKIIKYDMSNPNEQKRMGDLGMLQL